MFAFENEFACNLKKVRLITIITLSLENNKNYKKLKKLEINKMMTCHQHILCYKGKLFLRLRPLLK